MKRQIECELMVLNIFIKSSMVYIDLIIPWNFAMLRYFNMPTSAMYLDWSPSILKVGG